MMLCWAFCCVISDDLYTGVMSGMVFPVLFLSGTFSAQALDTTGSDFASRGLPVSLYIIYPLAEYNPVRTKSRISLI